MLIWGSIKSNLPFYDFFVIYCNFSKILSKINKRKKEKPLPPHPQTVQGGCVDGFVSLRILNGRFCCSWRKSRFGPKLREIFIYKIKIPELGLMGCVTVSSPILLWPNFAGLTDDERVRGRETPPSSWFFNLIPSAELSEASGSHRLAAGRPGRGRRASRHHP